MPKNDNEKLAAFVKQAMQGKTPAQLAMLFQALAAVSRVRILQTLLDGEQSVIDLGKIVGTLHATTSNHLGKLRARGLVTGVRAGKKVFYSIAK